MKKGLIWIISVLMAFAVAVLILPMFENHDAVGEENESNSIAVSESIYTSEEVNMEAASTEGNAAEEITEATESIENKATVPQVVEVVKEDAYTDKIVLENKDGEKSEIYMGVVDLQDNVSMSDEDDADSDEGKNNENIETNQDLETETPKTEVGESTIVQAGHIGTNETITFLEYEAMSGEEQMLFYYSFANAEAFTEWYNNAKAEYEASINKVYIGADGSVDIENAG